MALRVQISAFLVASVLLLTGAAALTNPLSGEFRLIDQTGAAVTERSYDGKLRIVFFGFTRCPHVCPTSLYEIGRALRILGPRAADVQPIFISIDPDHDTPPVLAAYVAAFHPSLVGLTGTPEQVSAAAAAFNVAYGSQPGPSTDGGALYHANYLYLMDRNGRFVDVLGYGSKAEAIARRLGDYL